MGPCKECGKWHCECVLDFLDELAVVKDYAHRAKQLVRFVEAKADLPFQRFIKQCFGDEQR